MHDLSPGERAFRWVRAELRSAASRPALILGLGAIAGALAEIASAVLDSVSSGGGVRVHLIWSVGGLGLLGQLLLVLASLLLLVDGLALRPGDRWPALFHTLAVLGGLGVVANVAGMISLLTEEGVPPAPMGTLAEAYASTVLMFLAPAVLAAVPLYIGVAGRRMLWERRR